MTSRSPPEPRADAAASPMTRRELALVLLAWVGFASGGWAAWTSGPGAQPTPASGEDSAAATQPSPASPGPPGLEHASAAPEPPSHGLEGWNLSEWFTPDGRPAVDATPVRWAVLAPAAGSQVATGADRPPTVALVLARLDAVRFTALPDAATLRRRGSASPWLPPPDGDRWALTLALPEGAHATHDASPESILSLWDGAPGPADGKDRSLHLPGPDDGRPFAVVARLPGALAVVVVVDGAPPAAIDALLTHLGATFRHSFALPELPDGEALASLYFSTAPADHAAPRRRRPLALGAAHEPARRLTLDRPRLVLARHPPPTTDAAAPAPE